ncbi:MAG: CHASE3 domain-containing protein [Methylobacteriaceae bacterium]|nr:CHASE3 domain-containing protein [Methylobacteriaceae bacterium]MBV9218184.1 CHASE3 domain-containing protein [Methylobacteriaceae bacterium]MBV9244859.1 CHASE3 domain-containing protein [Methylobacteriaceae bacterium]MBV9635961.1 CHASE3 domain-containing protein [Methylobacteriaceae bacterium]MBV9702601.1 CHASE3 domain-containing protein [Methylobacteriaceae bacterium]
MDRTIFNVRRTALARVAVFLLIGAVAAAGVAAWLGRVASQSVYHTLEVQRAATRLWNALATAESAQRGYIITGDDGYLEPYKAAMARMPTLLTALKQRVSERPDQVDRVARIMADVEKRLNLLSGVITSYQQGRKEEAIAGIREGGGKAIMERMSNEFTDLQAREDENLVRRQATFKLYEVLLFASIVAAVLVSLMVFLLQRQLAQENIRALETAATGLSRAKAGLEELVAARTEALASSTARAEQLARQLAENLRRFDLALKGSAVTAFTQDRDLRYTWISRDQMEREVAAIVGRTDEELLDGSGGKMIALKRSVIDSGEPTQGEIRLQSSAGERWYDIHLEASRSENGSIIGLIGASVDITDRREREGRIRLLLREITHRSKNLLAVIQSMARQTAQRTTSSGEFVEIFSKRIQSLALSHDLLVQGDWTGAALRRVVEAQLAPFSELIGTRITLDGPELKLKPEAAQGLGMAIHELVTNAARFGALSGPSGTIRASWQISGNNSGEERRMQFEWREQGVPKVTIPEQQGFGHVVLEGATARALSGKSQFTYAADGATWSLDIPGEWIMA